MTEDRWVVRAVVVFLGLATLSGFAGLVFLVATTDVRDAALLGLVAGPAGTALGALATLLARTGGGAAPVQVVNQGDEPVPVVAGG